MKIIGTNDESIRFTVKSIGTNENAFVFMDKTNFRTSIGCTVKSIGTNEKALALHEKA